MKEYKFKCKSCGATKYEKDGNMYKCKYCGETIEVFDENDADISFNAEKNDSSATIEERETIIKNPEIRELVIKLLLCIFTGVWGVHKFWEGKIVLGVIYCCTFGIFGIGLFIDAVVYICQLIALSKGGENGE